MAEREEQKQAKLFQERIANDLSAAVPSASQSAHAEQQIQRTVKVGPSPPKFLLDGKKHHVRLIG